MCLETNTSFLYFTYAELEIFLHILDHQNQTKTSEVKACMKRRRILLWITAGILILFLAADAWEHGEKTTASVMQVERKTIYYSVLADGEVTVPNASGLFASQSGKVTAVYAKVGEEVEAGQPLFTIETTNSINITSEDALKDWTQAWTEGESAQACQSAAAFAPWQTNWLKAGSKIVLTAPQTGTVLRLPETGDGVWPELSLGRIGDLSQLQIQAKVPEEYADQVKAGQSVKISGSSLGQKTCKGKVLEIAPYATKNISLTGEDSKRYVPVTIRFSAADSGLRPGSTVEVKIYTDQVKNAIVLPYEAVFQENKTEYVYQLVQSKAVRRKVETGYELSNRLQITKGLRAGDRVILNPQDVTEGETVQVYAEK
jgi:RND family efflux transporter MFP subunit